MNWNIVPFQETRLAEAIDCALEAWAPVFSELRQSLPEYAYSEFYPDGWRARQRADVSAFLDAYPDQTLLAIVNGDVAGWAGYMIHADDRMGELAMICIRPSLQRKGIARALVQEVMGRFRSQGLKVAMVETGGDPGHAAARAAYLAMGFESWPTARFMRKV